MAELQQQIENLKEKKNLTRSELDIAYRSLNLTDGRTKKLMKELENEKFDKANFRVALGFSQDNNCVVNERVRARETRKLKNQLAGMKSLRKKKPMTVLNKGETPTFFLNKTRSVNGNKTQAGIQLSGEKLL